jgi:hypothetical protein
MSNIVIKGATTGTGVFTLESPATNTDRTLVLPDEAGTVLTTVSGLTAGNLTGSVPASAMPSGSVLQVVQSIKTDSMAAAPGALWADVPGQGGVGAFSATITPSSASSKILIMVDVKGAGINDYSIMRTRLLRGSTPIYVGDAAGSRPQSLSQFYIASGGAPFHMAQIGGTFLDSPATTGSTTYKLQFGADSSTNVVFISRTQSDRNAANYDARVAASIILMEIAG